MIDVAHLTLANPASVTVTYQRILQRYGVTGFNGFIWSWYPFRVRSVLSVSVPVTTFRIYSTNDQTLNQKKVTLTQQRDSAIADSGDGYRE
jgi:hypothetical protein